MAEDAKRKAMDDYGDRQPPRYRRTCKRGFIHGWDGGVEHERATYARLVEAARRLVHATEYNAQHEGHPSWCKSVIDGHPCSCGVGGLRSAHGALTAALAEIGGDDG